MNNTRNQLLCAHCAIPVALLCGVGGFVITGFLPPPSPSLDIEETAAIIRGHTSLRIGFSLLATGAPFFMGLAVAIWAQLRRSEQAPQVLSTLQMLAATVGVLALLIPAYLWLGVSYRPDTPATVVTTFSDIAFFLLLCSYAPAVVQEIAIGICILSADKQSCAYPRWVGFANLWLAFTLVPGVIAPFFRTGPFTYSGAIGFWLVAVGFFAWLALMWWYTVKAIQGQDKVQTARR